MGGAEFLPPTVLVSPFKKGKALYHCPEFYVDPPVDLNGFKIDLWCMGIVLFILLTSRAPYKQNEEWQKKLFAFYKTVRSGRLHLIKVISFLHLTSNL